MGHASRWVASAVALALIVMVATAQGGSPQQRAPHPPAASAETSTVPANPEDVRSVDTILAALYDTISGPAGQHRDWNRLRSLFVPGARLVAIGHTNGDIRSYNFSVEEYISRATQMLEREGFYEREIARHTDAYEHIAQVFSTYESRHAANEKPFTRGINSVQLMNDGHRWWVVTIFWEPETQGHPIPKKYLRGQH